MCFLKVTIIFSLVLFSAQTLLAQDAARTEAVFPVFARTAIVLNPGVVPDLAVIDAFHSRFVTINPNASDVNVTFQVFDKIGREVIPANSFTVPANSFFGAFGDLPLNFSSSPVAIVGWVRINASKPVIVQEEIFHSEDRNVFSLSPPTRTVKSRILKSAGNGLRRAVIEVSFIPQTSEADGQITGISIVFPSSATAESVTGTLVIRNLAGEKVGQRELSISANGQIIGVIPELLPDVSLPTNFRGTLELNFDHDVFVAAIHMRSGSKSGEGMDEPNAGSLQ